MSKILVDQALIEQAIGHLMCIDAWLKRRHFAGLSGQELRIVDALQATLAEPAVEPFGYFRAEPFGWTDCAPTDEGAKALYEVPPPAEPARTSQDVCTVPLLSDDEVAQCIKDASKGSAINRDGSTSQRIVRSAEQLVRRKARL